MEQRIYCLDHRHELDFQYLSSASTSSRRRTPSSRPFVRRSLRWRGASNYPAILEVEPPGTRAWFVREVLVRYLPAEVLPGDLIAGGRFNVMTSTCLTERETTEYKRLVDGKMAPVRR